MKGDAFLEVLCDALGLEDDGLGVGGGEGFVCGFGEKGEPSMEVLGVEGELEVSEHGVAFVAAGGVEDGGPEVFEGGEMEGPVGDDGVEDGADLFVAADFGVERIYQGGDFVVGDGLHGTLFR